MAAKNGRKQIFGKRAKRYCIYPRGQKFHQNNSISTISEINVFMSFMHKLKMNGKSSGIMIFGKKYKMTLQIPCQSNISSKSFHLAPLLK